MLNATSLAEPTGHSRCADRTEDGLTLVELLVALAVSMVILAGMTTVITVYTKAEAFTVRSTNAASTTRTVLLALQHDIQSAVQQSPSPSFPSPPPAVEYLPETKPLTASSNYTNYQDELELSVPPPGGASGANQNITWRYDPTTEDLTRQINTDPPVTELSHVTNGTGLAVFSYFDRCGNNLVTSASTSGADPHVIADDATLIQVDLAVKDVSSAPFGTQTSVFIMSREPGLSPCG